MSLRFYQIIFVPLLNKIERPADLKKHFVSASIRSIFDFFRFPEITGHIENAKLMWLIRLRWLAIGLFLVMTIPGKIYGVIDGRHLVIFVGLVGILFLFNLLTYLFYSDGVKPIGALVIGFQLSVDLFFLTGLLFISGGFSNPFVGLFLINAGLGGVLIRGRNSWPFVILCHACLIFLQIQFAPTQYELSLRSLWIFIVVSHILLFTAWVVLRSLGTYLENHFENLTSVHIQNEKHDRLRALGALAAGFSHEFASPLNAAKLRLDRLSRALEKMNSSDLLRDQLKQDLHEARLSIQNCEAVIFSMNSSQLDIREHQIKPVSMIDFIQDVTDSWLEDHPQARLQIENHITQKLLVSPINFAQVIINLLDNAFEADHRSEIDLKLFEANGYIEMSVEDHGPGFNSIVLKRLGEPFLTTKEKGTGLGLYVSELFVQSLGGHLKLQNKSDSTGAIVILRWPIHQRNVTPTISELK